LLLSSDFIKNSVLAFNKLSLSAGYALTIFSSLSYASGAGKDKTQVQQKRYRYTGKERDDSSGLSYYGARYLAPWLTYASGK
jgi:hypothetical protein